MHDISVSLRVKSRTFPLITERWSWCQFLLPLYRNFWLFQASVSLFTFPRRSPQMSNISFFPINFLLQVLHGHSGWYSNFDLSASNPENNNRSQFHFCSSATCVLLASAHYFTDRLKSNSWSLGKLVFSEVQEEPYWTLLLTFNSGLKKIVACKHRASYIFPKPGTEEERNGASELEDFIIYMSK